MAASVVFLLQSIIKLLFSIYLCYSPTYNQLQDIWDLTLVLMWNSALREKFKDTINPYHQFFNQEKQSLNNITYH